MHAFKELLSSLKPYTIFIIYGSILLILSRIIPSPKHFVLLLEAFYRQYGYIVVFFSALAEGSFLLGFYVPGSTAILFGAVFARSGVLFLPFVIICAVAGLVIGYSINYFLGKYGFYHVLHRMGLEKGFRMAEQKLKAHYKKTLLLSYIHPGSGALISTAAGVLGLPYWKFLFLTVVSQLFWAIVWGSLAYMIGLPLVELFMNYFGVTTVALVTLWYV